jgi:hypothetical protein
MSDSDDEIFDEEYIQNEAPLPGIDSEFREAILEVKKSLNNNIINGPELGTREAQSINRVNDYIKALNEMYVLSLNAQKGINVINDKNLSLFPVESKEKIEIALKFIMEYFKKLDIADRIPYESYVKNSFKDNQFLLHNNFEE